MTSGTDFAAFEEPTYYEILEVGPGASEEEVRQAYKRAQEIYARDSMVVYTLFSDDELEDLHRQVTLAYDTIIDPRKRHEYDLSLLGTPQEGTAAAASGTGAADEEAPEVTPRPTPTPSEVPASLPADVEMGPDTVFSGELLRRIREHKGVDLRDVSNRTKISVMNLRMMEEMRFDRLQAPVYVRGFLKEYARYLRLPEQQVVDTYMTTYREHLGREQR